MTRYMYQPSDDASSTATGARTRRARSGSKSSAFRRLFSLGRASAPSSPLLGAPSPSPQSSAVLDAHSPFLFATSLASALQETGAARARVDGVPHRTHFSPYLYFPGDDADTEAAAAAPHSSNNSNRRSLPAPAARKDRSSAFARREHSRRCIDTWSSAELLVLRELVDRAVNPHKFPSLGPRASEQSSSSSAAAPTARDSVPPPSLSQQPPRKSSSAFRRVSFAVESLLSPRSGGASTRAHNELAARGFDYSNARRRYYRERIDRRLRLKKLKHLTRLFPMLACVHRAALKRLFAVLDRDASGAIEFSELCETLAHSHTHSMQQNADLVFLWFQRSARLTSSGAHLLLATLKELLAAHDTLAAIVRVPDVVDALPELLLRGQHAISLQTFRRRIAPFDDIVSVLVAPLNVVRAAMAESKLWHEHQTTVWCDVETAYVVSRTWWNQWLEYILHSDPELLGPSDDAALAAALRASVSLATGTAAATAMVSSTSTAFVAAAFQHQHEQHARFRCRPGPIDNRDICDDEQLGTLQPQLEHNVHFVLLAPRVWHALVQIYGGGPEFPRRQVAPPLDGGHRDGDAASAGTSGPEATSPASASDIAPARRCASTTSSMSEAVSSVSTVRCELSSGGIEAWFELYPLALQLRLTKHESHRVRLVFARRFLLSRETTLRALVLRLGLVVGENASEVTLWMRRQRTESWKSVEWSATSATSPTLDELRVQSSYELLVDYRPMTPSYSRSLHQHQHQQPEQSDSDSVSSWSRRQSSMTSAPLPLPPPLEATGAKPFAIALFRPMGNDFVCTDRGLVSRALASLESSAAVAPLALPADPVPGRASDNCTRSTKQSSESRATSSFSSSLCSPPASSAAGDTAPWGVRHAGLSPSSPAAAALSRRLVLYPGVRATGLLNLGNTCFMNCALQCLAHSPLFREYLLAQRQLQDANKRNVLGTRGRVANVLARLVSAMWKQQQHAFYVPELFRDVFTALRQQFEEPRQHDAHEFIVALLDSLHEDLNHGAAAYERKPKRRLRDVGCFAFLTSRPETAAAMNAAQPTSRIASEGATVTAVSDAAIAAHAWQRHAQVNSSVVVDLFHGQTQSETICGTCHARSVTFDPSVFFSLPIPEPKFVRIDVRVVLQVRVSPRRSSGAGTVGAVPAAESTSAHRPVILRGFWIKRGSLAGSLADQIAAAYGLQGNRVLLVEVRRARIKRVIEGDERLDAILHSARDVFAYERAWTLGEIPRVPSVLTRCDARFAKPARLRRFRDIAIGSRVDAVGVRGDWFPGTVVDLVHETAVHRRGTTEHQQRCASGSSSGARPMPPAPSTTVTTTAATWHVCVHFDGFSAKWNAWFTDADWHDKRIAPVGSRVKTPREVFEVQVVHRYVTAALSSSRRRSNNSDDTSDTSDFAAANYPVRHVAAPPLGASSGSLDTDAATIATTTSMSIRDLDRSPVAFEIFGTPLFVTVESDRTSRDLHHAILLQAARFIDGFDVNDYACQPPQSPSSPLHASIHECAAVRLEALPYTVRVANLEELSETLGTELPFDSSGILQHFSTRSVVVLDWKRTERFANSGSSSRAQAIETVEDDDVPPEMALDEREAVPVVGSAGVRTSGTRSSNRAISLDKCMDAFLTHEAISLDDRWICARCGVAREGRRKAAIWRLPDLVMIQLKRFQYLENQHRQKVRALVDFPLNGLDFAKWMATPSSGNATGSGGSGSALSSSPDTVYDLYAVANHVGGLTRGHYTASCRYDRSFEESARVFTDAHDPEVHFSDAWFRFDDDKVSEIPANDVVTDAAYVLFYKRRTLSSHNVLEYAL